MAYFFEVLMMLMIQFLDEHDILFELQEAALLDRLSILVERIELLLFEIVDFAMPKFVQCLIHMHVCSQFWPKQAKFYNSSDKESFVHTDWYFKSTFSFLYLESCESFILSSQDKQLNNILLIVNFVQLEILLINLEDHQLFVWLEQGRIKSNFVRGAQNIFYNYQMDIEQEQQFVSQTSIHYIFSLKALNASRPKCEADFSPLRCKKTDKLIQIIPTYNQDFEVAFSTEIDQLKLKRTQSMNVLANKENRTPQHIYLPKPISNYCQVCREHFADYLQHIAHPIHKKNAEQANSHFSIESLKEALDSPHNRTPKQPEVAQSHEISLSLISCKSHSGTSLEGSKNTQLYKEEKETDRVSIESGELGDQNMGDVPTVIKRRQHKKYSNFRALRFQQRQQETIEGAMQIEE